MFDVERPMFKIGFALDRRFMAQEGHVKLAGASNLAPAVSQPYELVLCR